MSKIEIRQKRRIRELEFALRPFADVKPAVEGTDSVWLYCGQWAPGQENPHLLTEHFADARKVLS